MFENIRPKVRYHIGPKEVVAEVTYRGKKYYGRSHCHPKDTFDPEIGKKIALARLEERVARSKFKIADENLKFWNHQEETVSKSRKNAFTFYNSALGDLINSKKRLEAVMNEINQ